MSVYMMFECACIFYFEVVMFGGNACYLLEIRRIAYVWEHAIRRTVVTSMSSQCIGFLLCGKRPRVGL